MCLSFPCSTMYLQAPARAKYDKEVIRMNENDIKIHNVALLYEIMKTLHPDSHIDLTHIIANYDDTVKNIKELLS